MEYYIYQFCIDYNIQGTGLGGEFIKLIEGDNKRKGLNKIILNIERGYPTQRFYKKMDLMN